jgi:hypothetical protein
MAGLGNADSLSATRLRDFRSSIKGVARLLGDNPAHIQVDLPDLGRRLAACVPATRGITQKTFTNIRSNFLAAVKASGIGAIHRPVKRPISPGWRKLFEELSSKRGHIGLSRFACWCSGQKIEPGQVNDPVLTNYVSAVRNVTLHRKPNELHRKVAQIWNEAAQNSRLDLKQLTVPSFRQPAKRLDWSLLPDRFRKDLEAYLRWCGGLDTFAADARSRALAPQTLKLRRDQFHAAVTALVASGVRPTAIRFLGTLVSQENFRRILRQRDKLVGGRESVFNHDLAVALVDVARRWVKVNRAALGELKRLARRVPTPALGLTTKNKATLRQFDDPANLRRLYEFSSRLWGESNATPARIMARW